MALNTFKCNYLTSLHFKGLIFTFSWASLLHCVVKSRCRSVLRRPATTTGHGSYWLRISPRPPLCTESATW